jgi:hypothetical protein
MLNLAAQTNSGRLFSWVPPWRLLRAGHANPRPVAKAVNPPTDQDLTLLEAKAICSLWWLL